MTGAFLAIAGALSFAFGAVVVRRAVIKVLDATSGVLITVPMSVPFFLLVLLATGQIGAVGRLPWQGYLWLSAAGVVHFVIGRSLSYRCTQLLGANIANVIRRVSPLVAVALGIGLLGEPLSWQLVAGVILIIGGITISGLPSHSRSGGSMLANAPRKAVLFGLGAGLCWGISPVLVKLGLPEGTSPVAGAFISFAAATVVLMPSLLNPDKRASLSGMDRRTVALFTVDGLFSSTAQLLRYIALGLAPVSLITPLFSTSPIFVIVLSYIFNRKIEVFSPNIIVGTIATVAGSFLLI